MLIKKAVPSKPPVNRSDARAFFALKPLAHAVALMLTVSAAQAAPRPMSADWFAAKAAARAAATQTGRPSSAGAISPQLQQERARVRLQRSIDNLAHTAGTIAAQRAAQDAARKAAQAAAANIAAGLAEGGLKVDTDSLTAGWLNAKDPTQSVKDGHTTVNIEQTADKAILNWETFNVSRDTTVDFQQQSNWAVLNRVNDPNARPSQIQGQINGDGTVMLVNRNGVVFSGSSQVNVRNLTAAAAEITDQQFTERGLYGNANGEQATFTGASGDVTVEAGARLETSAPAASTDGGGYVLLLGRQVNNAGTITTDRGQATLAAGDDFYIRKGRGSEQNQAATTMGNEVAVGLAPDSGAGKVTNSGLMVSAQGDITLTGHDVRQQGVAIATTTVNQRGTVHLLNSASDAGGRVTLGENSVTAVLIDDNGDTALDSQRQALIDESARLDLNRGAASTGRFDNLADLPDRRDQSRVEIVSGGDVVFEDGSMSLATGGQIAVDAQQRVRVAEGAEIDVAGAVGVKVAMESNNVLIDVQGNDLRDSPDSRDDGGLNNGDVWVDRRDLILVPAGTGGYDTDRWYTAGGLLEVSGYLDTQGHRVGEWAATGGTVLLKGQQVVTERGSAVNLSGGSLDVQTGYVSQTYLKGADGNLYNASNAPGYMLYTGLYRGYERVSERWGRTDTYRNPLVMREQRLENGYTTGRDAGQLIVSAPTAVLEGDIIAEVHNGERQNRARNDGLDGYRQAQNSVARGGRLLVGDYDAAGLRGGFDSDVRIGDIEDITPGLAPDADLGERAGTVWLDAQRLSAQGLGGLDLVSAGRIAVERDVTLAAGAQMRLASGQVDVDATVTAAGGDLILTNMIDVRNAGGGARQVVLTGADGDTHVRLGAEGVLDARGVWSNSLQSGSSLVDLAYRDGGSVTLSATHNVTVEAGSLIDVSSGAGVDADGELVGGRGGDITLRANVAATQGGGENPSGILTLDGELRGYGVDGGGTLTLESGQAIVVGGQGLQTNGVLSAGETAPVDLTLLEELVIAAGETLPFDYQYTRTSASPGQPLGDSPITISPAAPLTLAAAWTIPASATGTFRVLVGNTVYGSGSTVPAGATITNVVPPTAGTLPADYRVPADAFPNGIPVQASSAVLLAGTPLPSDITFTPGQTLAAGTILSRDVRVRPVVGLAEERFQLGFSNYQINGHRGVRVADGAQVEVTMPVYRFRPGARGADTREQALELWTLPLYQPVADDGKAVRRGGASVTLTALRNGVPASIAVGAGSTLAVDPGQSILLNGRQTTVEGTLRAQGGRIDILNPLTDATSQAGAPGSSIWIGDQALLDASGYAYVATDARGRRYGEVLDGGQVTLGSAAPEDFGEFDVYDLNNQFVIVRDGAVIDVSGAHAELDLGKARPTTVAGNAGGLALRSNAGIYFDGELRAQAGGEGAAGGALEVMLETLPTSAESGIERQAELRNIILGNALESGAPQDLQAGKDDPGLRFGQARFDTGDIVQSGVDSLSLWARDAILFQGDTDLRLARQISLSAAVIGAAPDTPDITVDLSAPYVNLAGRTTLPAPADSNNPGTAPFFVYHPDTPLSATTHADSRFRVRADLIDLGWGALTFGGQGTRGLVGGQNEAVDLPGFAAVELDSQGDLRLDNTVLMAEKELHLIAERIYPTTHSVNVIRVGIGQGGRLGDPVEGAVLRLGRHGEGVPEVPPSAFGSLYLQAPEIDHAGVLMAPLGTIGLIGGSRDVDLRPLKFTPAVIPVYLSDQEVAATLHEGSVTSISGAGLTLPYGYTTDGINYFYNEKQISFDQPGTTNSEQAQRVSGGIRFSAATLLVEDGALIDTSAGGVLQGVGYRSGRGGSVDILHTALANAAPWHTGAGDNPVYAIVAGFNGDAAPLDPALAGPGQLGRQITIGAGVPGLPAGTYTLLPAEYALLPGGYRVELGESTRYGTAVTAHPAQGLYTATVQTGLANSGIVAAEPRLATIMAGDTVRRYGDYDETTLSQWVAAKQAQFGAARIANMIPEDIRPLLIDLGYAEPGADDAFRFLGELRSDRVAGGSGGLVALHGANLEVISEIGTGTADRISLLDDDLNGFGATVLGLGINGAQGHSDPGNSVVLRSGSTLRAGTVLLGGSSNDGESVRVESGATIDTRGYDASGWTAQNGFVLEPLEDQALLAVSNDLMTFGGVRGEGRLRVEDGAGLYGEGSVALLAPGGAGIGRIGLAAKDLLLGVESINIGTDQALEQASAGGVLSAGWRLTQGLLDDLLQPAEGAGVERLSFQAADSINFFGPVALDTYDADTGESRADLRFITPAIYGLAGDGESASIRTDQFTWSGLGFLERINGVLEPVAGQPGPVIDGGAGTGNGGFRVDANEVRFGFNGPLLDETANLTLERLMLGFQDVQFNARDRITSERNSSLAVYQSALGEGQYQGGNLTLNAPVLTGQAGSDMTFRAGGTLTVARPDGAEPLDRDQLELGGRLALDANRVRIDGTVAAPSGRIEVHADQDVELTEGSVLDVAGRAVEFFDVTRHSFGGDLVLESRQGDVRQAAGSTLDVSASGSDAGVLKVTAAHGAVALDGDLRARAAGQADTGFEGGTIQLEGLTIADFVGLNQRLGDGGFDYRRDFTVGSGDLVIGDELRARHLSVTADGGSLTVAGTVRAGGQYAGSLRLAARDDLVIDSGAVLDASGDQLKRDSQGDAIEGSNRATLDLTTREGRLVLADGATLDVSAGGEARGGINLNAPRLGGATGNDVAVDAAGGLTVRGAKKVAVNGFWTYDDAPLDPEDDTTQIIDKDYLDQLDQDSTAFVNGALANARLLERLAGLRDVAGDAFQLRPGVDIVSATPDGNLRVAEGLDLAGYRYGPDVDADVRGSGVAGVFSLRAGGDLTVNGDISDGFEVPLTSPDSEYFLDFELEPGQVNGSKILLRDLTVPQALTLAAGWAVASAQGPLPFDVMPARLSIRAGSSVDQDVVIAAQMLINGTLNADITLPNAVSDLRTGVVYGPGVVPAGTTMLLFAPAGTRFQAGYVFSATASIQPRLLPAGTDLSPYQVNAGLGAEVTLAAGATLPKGFQLSSLKSADAVEQNLMALAPVLEQGRESWDLRLVAGADLASASSRAVRADALAGDLVLSNPAPERALIVTPGAGDLSVSSVNVIRTGVGNLELIAARDYRHDSLFGVYTAGGALPDSDTPPVARPDGGVFGAGYDNYQGSAAVTDVQAGFLTGGGDVLVSAGRDLSGYNGGDRPTSDWLWTQNPLASGEQSAWWIHSGTYVKDGSVQGRAEYSVFSGIGALGGGNVTLFSGRHLGADRTDLYVNGGLNVVVGASGWRGADGEVSQVGGGDLRIDAGGAINPVLGGPGSKVTNLRGDIQVRAGEIGRTWQTFAPPSNNTDPRPDDLIAQAPALLYGRLNIVAGDATARLLSVGDLVLSMVNPLAGTGLDLRADRSGVTAFSAGGDVALGRGQTPSSLSLVASEGSIYGAGAQSAQAQATVVRGSLEGTTELLAADSIYHLGLGIESHPDAPGVAGLEPARFYAVSGDIYGLDYGFLRPPESASDNGPSLLGRPAWIRAGRDIVDLGQVPGAYSIGGATSQIGAAFGHHAGTDVSLIEAGRDLIFINAVAVGPGTLEVTAGRNFYQAGQGWVRTVAGASDTVGGGADIAINVGMGEDGPDYQALIDAYLNPANLADPERPLADQPDKVVKIYNTELRDWLLARYGEDALADSAPLDYFAALAAEQQRIFLRELYYAELRAGGREYNDPDSARTGSYLRGRRVIGTLLPKVDSEAGTSGYQGDYTMFSTGGGSGLVRTEGGGNIRMLVPGGDLTVGVEGVRPESADNGILTQGSGDIQLYTQGDIALGLSRIFTTYGGDIFAWSGAGDINAGRGAKTTLVYTPPRRVYDDIGNVALSPAAPSTGAGIATLAPIPEVPPGDIDLIAPLGIIDAGEAGIRVSGNVNIAALQVVNAENIEVQGDATGLPVVAAVNVSALTSASNAANSAVQAAEQVGRRSSNRPSVITVEILGYGEERLQSGGNPSAGARYQPQGPVQVLGVGQLSNGESAPLTDAERRSML
tara:strand:+ start:10790 stop:22960 length:12171 start_codon:yes stop_codon:yes gene_type:complete